MKRSRLVLTIATALALVVFATWASGQGRGSGFGAGPGPRGGRGAGYGRAQAGAGGWWMRVTPQTPEQEALVKQVTELHTRIRTLHQEIRLLQAQKAPAEKIAEKQKEVTALRAQLQRVTGENRALLQQMGLPANRGVCNGTGPKGPALGQCPFVGPGRGQGRGFGRGSGLRLRDGSGPNPFCPLKTQQAVNP